MTLQTHTFASPVVRKEIQPHLKRPAGKKLKIVQFGLGPIGVETVRLLATKPWADVVGGIDIDPAKIGKKLGDVCGVPSLGKQEVLGNFTGLIEQIRPDVVIHTAGSKAQSTIEQILPMARAGVSVVTSCEEMVFPYYKAPEAAHELDEICRASGARVVGTGVNPGFLMDTLPICLTGVNRSVDSIYAERFVDTSTRRMQLQRKTGCGLKPDEFRALAHAGKAGHAGFEDSAAFLCHLLGWDGAKIEETIEPVVADRRLQTPYFDVKPGQTCGLYQVVTATFEGRKVVEMVLQMSLDVAAAHDLIRIEGDPPIEVRFVGGLSGDRATIAALANAAPRLLQAPPGLRLMTELPVPAFV